MNLSYPLFITGGRTIIPGVTAGEVAGGDANTAGSGLGSLVDMTGGASSLSSPLSNSNDPFSITNNANMAGGSGVLGTSGVSASAMAGMGGGAAGGPSSAFASRRAQSRAATSDSSSFEASTSFVGALVLLALMVL